MPSNSRSQDEKLCDCLPCFFMLCSFGFCIVTLATPIAWPGYGYDYFYDYGVDLPAYYSFQTCCPGCGASASCSLPHHDTFGACQSYTAPPSSKKANSTAFADSCPVLISLSPVCLSASIVGIILSLFMLVALCRRCCDAQNYHDEIEPMQSTNENDDGGDTNGEAAVVAMGDMIPPVGYAISRQDSNFNTTNNNNDTNIVSSPNKLKAIHSNNVNRHNIVTAMVDGPQQQQQQQQQGADDEERSSVCAEFCSKLSALCAHLTRLGIFYRVVIRICMLVNFLLLICGGVVAFWIYYNPVCTSSTGYIDYEGPGDFSDTCIVTVESPSAAFSEIHGMQIGPSGPFFIVAGCLNLLVLIADCCSLKLKDENRR